ncbi:MAG: hypothetical protein PHQ27_09310 [Victivallales bacterium]|nr:hypothetical protein [Victivallales bacterium]
MIIDLEDHEDELFNGFVILKDFNIKNMLSLLAGYSPPDAGNIFFGVDILRTGAESYRISLPDLEYPEKVAARKPSVKALIEKEYVPGKPLSATTAGCSRWPGLDVIKYNSNAG